SRSAINRRDQISARARSDGGTGSSRGIKFWIRSAEISNDFLESSPIRKQVIGNGVLIYPTAGQSSAGPIVTVDSSSSGNSSHINNVSDGQIRIDAKAFYIRRCR